MNKEVLEIPSSDRGTVFFDAIRNYDPNGQIIIGKPNYAEHGGYGREEDGEQMFNSAGLIPCRWLDDGDDVFQVYVGGMWCDSQSIDFEGIALTPKEAQNLFIQFPMKITVTGCKEYNFSREELIREFDFEPPHKLLERCEEMAHEAFLNDLTDELFRLNFKVKEETNISVCQCQEDVTSRVIESVNSARVRIISHGSSDFLSDDMLKKLFLEYKKWQGEVIQTAIETETDTNADEVEFVDWLCQTHGFREQVNYDAGFKIP